MSVHKAAKALIMLSIVFAAVEQICKLPSVDPRVAWNVKVTPLITIVSPAVGFVANPKLTLVLKLFETITLNPAKFPA